MFKKQNVCNMIFSIIRIQFYESLLIINPFYLLKALSQMWQMKGLSPRCFLLCLVNSSDLENLQPQSVQGQVKGFSPVCVLV